MKKLILVAVMGLGVTAWGQLTATVTPGYQFSTAERPSVATLNLLGLPTIEISGTVSGTVGLAPNSVSGIHLMNSVVDGVTVEFDGGSPRAIRIKDLGVSTAKLGANVVTAAKVAANAITRDAILDGALEASATGRAKMGDLYVTSAKLAADAVTSAKILDGTVSTVDLADGAITTAKVGAAQVTAVKLGDRLAGSENALPTTGSATSVTHGLGSTPRGVRWVLVCKTIEAGYAVGDEIDCLSVLNSASNPCFSEMSNTSTCVLVTSDNTPVVRNRVTGSSLTTITPGNWRVKVYANL